MRFGPNRRPRRGGSSTLFRVVFVVAIATAAGYLHSSIGGTTQASTQAEDLERGEMLVSMSVPAYPQLDCDIRPDIALFVPAGSEFMLFADHPDAPGRARVAWEPEAYGGRMAWREGGGQILGRARASIHLRTPSRTGVFGIRRSDEDGAVSHYVVVVTRLAKSTGAKRPRKRSTGKPVWIAGRYIGSYPDAKRSSSKRVRAHAHEYHPPLHFVEITAEIENIRLSPHLALGECIGPINHRDVKGPVRRHFQFFPPSHRLLAKVEGLAALLKSQGLEFHQFRVNSGFRTPAYNRRIRGSLYSRHIYGDALDLMIDENPRDGRMDDLNGDGRIDRKDGLVIADAVRELENAGVVAPGGIGVYEYSDPKSVGCHVHIDARGYITRWGVTYRGRKKVGFQWWPSHEYRE